MNLDAFFQAHLPIALYRPQFVLSLLGYAAVCGFIACHPRVRYFGWCGIGALCILGAFVRL